MTYFSTSQSGIQKKHKSLSHQAMQTRTLLALVSLPFVGLIGGSAISTSTRQKLNSSQPIALHTHSCLTKCTWAIPENRGIQKIETQFFSVENKNILTSCGKKLVTQQVTTKMSIQKCQNSLTMCVFDGKNLISFFSFPYFRTLPCTQPPSCSVNVGCNPPQPIPGK